MSKRSRRSPGIRLAAAVLCAGLGLLYGVGPVAAQSILFGTPSATSKFGVAIVFTQPYSGAAIQSANLLYRMPDDAGPAVSPVTSIGSGELVYSLDMSGGGPYPNTPITAHFEVVLADGSVQLGPEIDITYADDRFVWHTKVGKVVRLHYIDASDAFASQMLAWGEAGVQKAAAFFGVPESAPIDYFVYPSDAVFQQGLNQAGTIGGVTPPSAPRTCFAAVPNGDSYGQSVIPHELTHVVFEDAAGNPYHSAARWFNEGLAVYLSQGFDAGDRSLVAQAVKNGTIRSLLGYTDFFPLDSARIGLAYAESVSAVSYMVGKYGQAAVGKIVRAYAAGVTDDEAFKTGIGVDVPTFASAWLASNGVTSTKYGPQPAPTGPLPPGWNGSNPGTAVTPGPSGLGVATTPGSSPSPEAPSSTTTDSQDAYLVAAMIAVVGLVLLALAGLASARTGGRGAV